MPKPFGYSFFPKELSPCPKSWAAKTANLVHYGQHTSGGHFAVCLQWRALISSCIASADMNHRLWSSLRRCWRMLRRGPRSRGRKGRRASFEVLRSCLLEMKDRSYGPIVTRIDDAFRTMGQKAIRCLSIYALLICHKVLYTVQRHKCSQGKLLYSHGIVDPLQTPSKFALVPSRKCRKYSATFYIVKYPSPGRSPVVNSAWRSPSLASTEIDGTHPLIHPLTLRHLHVCPCPPSSTTTTLAAPSP